MSCGSDMSSAAFSIVPPIHHLPTELLVHVFHHLRETLVNRCSNPEDCQWTYETTSTDWAIVMLVCRYWCDVAYATPGLWRTIWIKDKDEIRRLPVALQRSHDTLIDVTLGAKVTPLKLGQQNHLYSQILSRREGFYHVRVSSECYF